MRHALTCLLFALLPLTGCGPPPKDPALVAYERFLGALRARSAAAVWRALSPDSQRQLATRLGLAPDAAEAAVLEVLGVRPGWGFELDLPQRARLDEAVTTADRRVVVGPLGGRARRIPLVQVEGAWRVDLFASTASVTPTAPGH